MFQLHSSYRHRPPSETFQIASEYLNRLGISRVTETTWLDSVGIPVSTAIRPSAQRGSLIVTAGKGVKSIEAKTGAVMEAIELAFSEESNSALKREWKATNCVLRSEIDPDDILRLCPKIGAGIDLDAKISVVVADDILRNNSTYLPAELVFIPFEPKENESRYFGYHTNGLASGNTYEEAVIHAIFEVIERDILSFDFVRDQSFMINPENVPEEVQSLIRKIKMAGIDIIIKSNDSPHQMPFFKAYIFDKYADNPTSINAGYGCHSDPQVALVRAITEAVQSRMSYIHGGREDLTKGYKQYQNPDQNLKHKFENEIAAIRNTGRKVDFKDVINPNLGHASILQYYDNVLSYIRRQNMIKEIYVTRHTMIHESIQVVKVVIPDMEFFNSETNRLGPRLRDHLQNLHK